MENSKDCSRLYSYFIKIQILQLKYNEKLLRSSNITLKSFISMPVVLNIKGNVDVFSRVVIS